MGAFSNCDESGLNGKDDEAENWITYYDIFVRNAFGSYRTVLKEVTYSPMMGQYLTYMQNKAFKFAGTFPIKTMLEKSCSVYYWIVEIEY